MTVKVKMKNPVVTVEGNVIKLNFISDQLASEVCEDLRENSVPFIHSYLGDGSWHKIELDPRVENVNEIADYVKVLME